jgi:hypothetical protein
MKKTIDPCDPKENSCPCFYDGLSDMDVCQNKHCKDYCGCIHLDRGGSWENCIYGKLSNLYEYFQKYGCTSFETTILSKLEEIESAIENFRITLQDTHLQASHD